MQYQIVAGEVLSHPRVAQCAQMVAFIPVYAQL